MTRVLSDWKNTYKWSCWKGRHIKVQTREVIRPHWNAWKGDWENKIFVETRRGHR